MPTVLLTVLSQCEIWRSLDTDSYAMALRRIHRVAADVEAEFEKARSAAGSVIDTALLMPSIVNTAVAGPVAIATPSPTTPKPSTRTIGEVYDRYIGDPKHTWSKRTAIAHTTTRK